MAEDDLKKRIEAAARKARKVGVFSLGDLNELLNYEPPKKKTPAAKPRVAKKTGGYASKKKAMPKKTMKK